MEEVSHEMLVLEVLCSTLLYGVLLDGRRSVGVVLCSKEILDGRRSVGVVLRSTLWYGVVLDGRRSVGVVLCSIF